MDTELQRYLNVVVLLLSLIAGLLATVLLVTTGSTSLLFVVVSLVIGAIVGRLAWALGGLGLPASSVPTGDSSGTPNTNCSTCGARISRSADSCEHCGQRVAGPA
ncbi:hypothetical protein [Haloarchaeobius sp. HRN-SO-5]|uniref:hypothetical protein n=1 Tax=Haloarchaeobius sp. HRN-SO-5 TaxID=3446118 RepID=UPI003EB762ED